MDLWRRLSRDDHDGPLAGLLITLTAASGMIDAVSLLRLGHVFGAAMTGNLLFIGVAVAGAPGFSISSSLTALGAFVAGSFIGGAVVARTSMRRGRLLRDAAAFQLAALGVATVILAVVGDTPAGATRYLLISILAAAMGVQTAAVRTIGVREVTTTVLTSTLSTLITDLRPSNRRAVSAQLRVLAIAVEVAGAVVGALLLLHVGTWCPLALAGVVVAAVVVVAHRTSRGDPVWSTPKTGH